MAPDAGRRLVLWRHGRTSWNISGRFQGRLDSSLDSEGLVDIEAAARVLAGLPPSCLVTSSAGRAVATASYLSRLTGLVADVSPELQEIELGAWQGLTRSEAAAAFPEEYAAWERGDDVRRGGGETMGEVGQRACGALLPLVASVPADGVLVAVMHGGTSRAVIGTLLGVDPSSWWRLAPLGNARWSVLMESRRGWRLAEHNAGVTEPADRGQTAAPDVDSDGIGAAAHMDV